MNEKINFEEYLVYDEQGNVLGIKQDAPRDVKIAYRKEYIKDQDIKRMNDYYDHQED